MAKTRGKFTCTPPSDLETNIESLLILFPFHPKSIPVQKVFPQSLLLLVGFLATFSCGQTSTETPSVDGQDLDDQSEVLEVMTNHLQAVSERNLEVLAKTLSPGGKMQLILPGAEMTNSVSQFLSFHETWFQDSRWTFDAKVVSYVVGRVLTMVIVEAMYREPERNGVPYFNRMLVSYTLQKIDGSWYVIKDHASSIEKSTDK